MCIRDVQSTRKSSECQTLYQTLRTREGRRGRTRKKQLRDYEKRKGRDDFKKIHLILFFVKLSTCVIESFESSFGFLNFPQFTRCNPDCHISRPNTFAVVYEKNYRSTNAIKFLYDNVYRVA